jgi:hypothetical protein
LLPDGPAHKLWLKATGHDNFFPHIAIARINIKFASVKDKLFHCLFRTQGRTGAGTQFKCFAENIRSIGSLETDTSSHAGDWVYDKAELLQLLSLFNTPGMKKSTFSHSSIRNANKSNTFFLL